MQQKNLKKSISFTRTKLFHLDKASPHLYILLCLCTFGTLELAPPEWLEGSVYRPGPTTVWQVGVVLFESLHNESHFQSTKFLQYKQKINKNLSESKTNTSIYLPISKHNSVYCSSHYDGLSVMSFFYLFLSLLHSRLPGFLEGVFE